MKYQVSLNGKQFEVEVEKGSVSAVPTGAAPAPAAPQVVLEGIDDTQAACVMAIVSHETGIPLDQLVFKSIKAV